MAYAQNEHSQQLSNLQPTPTISVNTSSGATSVNLQQQQQQQVSSLASLSRNTSVISSSSSSSSTSSLVAPIRPRPLRSFSQSPSPPAGRRARSPHSPTTPRQSIAPSYLTHQLGLGTVDSSLTIGASAGNNGTILPPFPAPTLSQTLIPGGIHGAAGTGINASADPNRPVTISSSLASANARPQMVPRTRTSSAVKKLYSSADFDFGEPLGDGSYSTVSLMFVFCCAEAANRRRSTCTRTAEHYHAPHLDGPVHDRYLSSSNDYSLVVTGTRGHIPSYRPSICAQNH